MKTTVIPVLVTIDFVNLQHVDQAVFFVTDEDHQDGEEGDSYYNTHKQLCYQIGFWAFATLLPSHSHPVRERNLMALWESNVNSIPNKEYDIYAENWSESITYWLGVVSAEIAKITTQKFCISQKVGMRVDQIEKIGVQYVVLY